MHSSITSHPEWQAFQDRRAKIAKARAAATAADAEWYEANERTKRDHAQAVRKAIDAGDPPPPVPPTPTDRPDGTAVLSATHAELASIGDAERSWLAVHADDLLAALHRQEVRLLREAGPYVELLSALLPEWAEVVATADQLRMVKGERRPANASVTAGSVVDAVTAGRGWVPRPGPGMEPPKAQPRDMVAYRQHLEAGKAKLAAREGQWRSR